MDYMRGGGNYGGNYGGGPPMGGYGGGMGMGGGGMGMGPPGPGPAPFPPIDFSQVSFDTSNNDPAMKAARVFVGNLNTASIDREELIRTFWRFGRIIGCTCFKVKGYAFIQYSVEDEARSAVMGTKGITFAGQVLDVKLACEGKGGGATKNSSNSGGGKRGRDDSSGPTPLMGPQMGVGMGMGFDGPMSKRPLFGATNPRAVYAADSTPADALQKYQLTDTLICGNCDVVFRDWVSFREHRKEKCDPDARRKPADEPDLIKCFVCKEEFKHSWGLLRHLSDLHHLTVYIDDANPDNSNGSTSVNAVSAALKKE